MFTLGLPELRERTSLKWTFYPPDVLPLWVAEMDVDVAPAIKDALAAALDMGDTGYAYGPAYAEAFARFSKDRWNFDIDVEHTRLMPDLMLGVTEMIRAFTEPGDAVIITPPVYPPFYGFIGHSDRKVVEAALTNGRLDLDRLARAFKDATANGRAAAFLLCNPHNPTGTVHSAQELAGVAALADEHGVHVISDEIHAPLTLPSATFVPYLSVADAGVSLLSASKGWNLAGLKTAVAAAGPRSAQVLADLPQEVGHGASLLAIIAHTAALEHARDWLDEARQAIVANRTLLAELLETHLPTARLMDADATYLAWVDCRALGLGDDPAAVFLERGRVAFSDGPSFGTGGAGWVRVNLATSPAIVEQAVARMAASL